MDNLIEVALAYLSNGYIPLRVELGSKAAAHAGWQKLTPNEVSIRRSFGRPSNIGLRTGDVKKDGTCLIAIDLDVDDVDLISVIEEAIGQKVPCKRGRKGYTWFFRLDRQHKTTKIYLHRDESKTPVIDVLCRGSQSVVPPSIHAATGEPYIWVAGTPLTELPYAELPVLSESVLDEITGYCRRSDDPIAQLRLMQWQGVGGGGNTHDTCVAAVASMVSRGWSSEDIHARIDRAKRSACEAAGAPYDWPEAQRTVQGWIDSARAKNFGSNPPGTGKQTHGVIAERFAAEHRDIFRYDRDRKGWYAFENGYWKEDSGHLVFHAIEQFLSVDLQNSGMVNGVLRSLENRPELSVRQPDWDRDNHLLHTPAGTVDLRTGQITSAAASDYITRSTSVAPAALMPDCLWLAKLREWFGDDPAELEYHQILAGYFLTGETRDPCLPIWLGPGGDGKSLIANTYRVIMGGYARTSTDTAFVETRHSQHSEEIAWLTGRRLVLLAEVTGTWHESRIKAVTGGENMSASFKGGKVFEFTPRFKLLVTSNQPPRLRSVGPEFRRRVHSYLFTRKIESPDPQLFEKLMDEHGQILSWMIEGAVKYYRGFLPRSPVVIASSEEYFNDNDTLGQWLEDRAEVEEGAKVEGQFAYVDFVDWCRDAGISQPMSRAAFTRAIKARGFEAKPASMPGRSSPVRVYVGFRLRGVRDGGPARF